MQLVVAVVLVVSAVWGSRAQANGLAGTAARHSTRGRIDIYVVDAAFDLAHARGSDGTRLGQCSWLGKGRENTGVSCEKRLGKDWEDIWVEFVPEGDGEVDIDLQGEWYEKENDEDIRLVWVDDVTVEGANIRNAGFEDAGPDGTPVEWRFTGAFPPERYSGDGSVAHSGSACVAVWYGSQARQQFAVKAGSRYRVRAWFRVVDPDRVHQPKPVEFEFPMETYTQELQIVFETSEAAQKASVAMTPLYNGYSWAVSCRWDDNNTAGLHMRDVMSAHGYRGTWYLNASRPGFGADIGRKLLVDGNSIGGHSMTHPFLTFANRNRQFWEVLGVRMLWEAAVDRPVCTYSFSFCDFRSRLEGDAGHRDIAEALRRAGYYHVANGWFSGALETDLELSPILPSDGAPIDDAAARFLNDPAHRRKHPNMSFSMHVWYATPEAWTRFEEQLDTYGGRPNWWYCNQNEYAAYRWQCRRTALGDPVRRGKELTVEIERPVVHELNDAVPLTLAVGDVEPEKVISMECRTADVEIAGAGEGPMLVNLHHDRVQRLPAAIGLIENSDNHGELRDEDVSDDFPEIGGLLHFRQGGLHLTLDNRGHQLLEDVNVIYRLPLAWKEGVIRRHVGSIRGQFRDVVQPTLARADYKYTSGTSFYAAQVDFIRAGQAGRLHLSCHVPNRQRDASYPQGGFLVLGPIPEGQFTAAEAKAAIRAAQHLQHPAAFSGEPGRQWRPESPGARDFLDVEIIETAGRWDNRGGVKEYYLLRSALYSDSEQAAGFLYDASAVDSIFVNGEQASGEGVRLRQGENELVLIVVRGAADKRFSAQNAGCFLRVVRPGTRGRLTNIRFERGE